MDLKIASGTLARKKNERSIDLVIEQPVYATRKSVVKTSDPWSNSYILIFLNCAQFSVDFNSILFVGQKFIQQ